MDEAATSENIQPSLLPELNLGISRSDDILVAGIWGVIGLFGIASNVLIMAGILHNRRMSEATSYWFILSLSICDISMLLVYFILLVPATTLHDGFMTHISPGNAAGVFIYDSFWYTGVFHLMLMAINRYINICHNAIYNQVFSPRYTVCLIGAAFLAGTAVSVPGLFPCCKLVYDHYGYVAIYQPETTMYSYADILVNGSSVLVLIYCYIRIVIRVRQSRMAVNFYREDGSKGKPNHRPIREANPNDNAASEATKESFVMDSSHSNGKDVPLSRAPAIYRRRRSRSAVNRREMRLFFQFCSVSLIFLLTWSTWQWLPYMSSSKWVGFGVTTLFFINNCANPTIYLIFNSSLRREIAEIFGFAKRKRRVGKKVSFQLDAAAKWSTVAITMRNQSISPADRQRTPKQSPLLPLLSGENGSKYQKDDDSDEESSSETSSSNNRLREGSMVANMMVAQFSVPCVIIGKASNAGLTELPPIGETCETNDIMVTCEEVSTESSPTETKYFSLMSN